MTSQTNSADESLARMRAMDPGVLAGVVRQDQRSPSFEISGWSVRRLSDKGFANPEGLYLFSGEGRDERSTRAWSVVLKVLQAADGVPINGASVGEAPEDEDIRNMLYWKREMLMVQSGLLESLPEALGRPRCYGATGQPGGGWIWMEYIQESPTPWTLDDYAFAARQMGRFDGAYLTGTPLPDFPWLANDYARRWTDRGDPDRAWEDGMVRPFFSPMLRERVKQCWGDRERFLEVLQRLPQVLSHFDCTRRNLMVRRRKQAGRPDDLIAIDWAWCGYGAAGGSLYALVGQSPVERDIDAGLVLDLDRAAFAGYLQGLRGSGWQGDADMIRLGFCAWTALWVGVGTPLNVQWVMTEEFRPMLPQLLGNASPEQLLTGWAAMCEYGMDLADEARRLMEKGMPL